MPHPPSSCRSELPEGAPPIVHHHSVLRRDAQGIGGGTKGGGGGQHERQAGAGCRVGNARQVKEACTRDAPNLVGKCSEACSREGWRGPCLLQPHMLETHSFILSASSASAASTCAHTRTWHVGVPRRIQQLDSAWGLSLQPLHIHKGRQHSAAVVGLGARLQRSRGCRHGRKGAQHSSGTTAACTKYQPTARVAGCVRAAGG